MESTISLTLKNNHTNHLSKYIDNIILIFLLLTIFFRAFQYYFGILAVTQYFTFPLALIFIFFQSLNLIKFNDNKTLLLIYFFFISWLFYGLITLFFSIQPNLTINVLAHRTASFLIFYVVTQFLTTKRRFSAFEKILFVCLIWNIGVAVWEITTFNHFPMSRFYNMPWFIPTGTFRNENFFCSILLILSSFLFFLKGKYTKHLAASLLFILSFIFICQGARMAIAFFFPLVVFFFIKNTNFLYKISVIIVILLSIKILFAANPLYKEIAKNHFQKQIMSLGSEFESLSIGSTKARLNLIDLSLEEFAATGGLGVGAGTFETLVRNPSKKDNIMGSIDAHLIFAEVLGTEGIIGLVLVCLIIFSCLKPIVLKNNKISFINLIKLWSLSDNEKHAIIIVAFFLISTTLIATYKIEYIYWAILGYAYAMMYNTIEQKS